MVVSLNGVWRMDSADIPPPHTYPFIEVLVVEVAAFVIVYICTGIFDSFWSPVAQKIPSVLTRCKLALVSSGLCCGAFRRRGIMPSALDRGFPV